jgi:uncharacterized protein YraI
MTSRRFGWMIRLLAVFVFLLLNIGLLHAATGEGIAITVGCDGFTTRSGVITFQGSEDAIILARDARGRELYREVIEGAPGRRYTFRDGAFFAWATEPQASPLVVSIANTGGSSSVQDVIYLVIGNCADLPRLASVYALGLDLDLLPLAVDGETAPSVARGAVPPRPTNPTTEVETLPGYAVVNTDNLFMRSGPGPQYTPVGIVDGGTRLIVLGRNDDLLPDSSDQLWWLVEVGGLRGWVNSAFLALRGDLSVIPVVEAQGEIIQPVIYIAFTGFPLSADPEPGARIVCGLQGERFYPVLAGDTSTPSWYYVEAQCDDGLTTRGWLRAEDIIFRNEGGVAIPVFGQ